MTDTARTFRTRTITWDDPSDTARAAAGRTGLQFLQAMAAGEIPAPPILATVGGRMVSAQEGRVEFAFEPAEYHYNPIGSVHGGVYSTLLDSALGCAVHSRLPEGVGYTSLDLSVKFLGSLRVDSGTVTCVGTVTHLGRRTALAEATMHDGKGRLVATATSTCMILGR